MLKRWFGGIVATAALWAALPAWLNTRGALRLTVVDGPDGPSQALCMWNTRTGAQLCRGSHV